MFCQLCRRAKHQGACRGAQQTLPLSALVSPTGQLLCSATAGGGRARGMGELLSFHSPGASPERWDSTQSWHHKLVQHGEMPQKAEEQQGEVSEQAVSGVQGT